MSRLPRLVRFSLGEVGLAPGRSWPLAAGVALGVGCLVFLLGLAGGVETLLRERVLGSLPDRIRVRPSLFRMGPVEVDGSFDDTTLERLRALPGVVEVYAQARLPRPCQLWASYGGRQFYSDIVLEGVSPDLVAPQVARGQRFEVGPETTSEIPAVLPSGLVDILNAGIAINTGLPRLNPETLVGRRFTLLVGTSSFSPGPYQRHRCVIVGVSDQIGLGGPAVPLEVLRRWHRGPLPYYAATLKLDTPRRVPEVAQAVRELGLATPGLDMAERISNGVSWVRLALVSFAAALLLVAGIGIFTGLSMQVREESGLIGLYRALGARRNDILLLYLTRAGALGLAGALTGLFLGIAAGFLLEAAARRLLGEVLTPGAALFRPGPLVLLGGLAFGPAVTLVAGLVPARRAADLHPAEALRRP